MSIYLYLVIYILIALVYAYWIHPFDRDKRLNVTHWQPLPEFKE